MRDLEVPTHDGHVLVATLHGPSGRDAGTQGAQQDHGTGVGVLLLHGLSQQRRFWDPVVRRLRARPVVSLDQRAHGDSDTPLGTDVSIDACARDALAAIDAAGLASVVVVGHSWGASVALRAAAITSTTGEHRISSVVLVDGGLWGPRSLGPRDEVRERLRPPALGIPEDDLWSMIAEGSGDWWSAETRAALAPTFRVDPDGTARTRIGVARHMAVLDGLLDYDSRPDLVEVAATGLGPIVVSCEEPGRPRSLDLPAGATLLRWEGAVHDVPLQWPALVAGLIDEVVEGAGRRSRRAGKDGPA